METPPPNDINAPTSQPPSLSPEEKQMGMLCHLLSFAGYVIPLGNIIGPLVLWQMKREQMPFVESEGKESVNFQISMTIYALVSGILMFFCVGIFLLAGVVIFDIIVVIMACVDAGNGKPYRYPLCIRFIK